MNHHTYDPGVLDELMMPSEDKKLIQVLCNTHKEVTAPASSRSSTSGNFDRKSTRTMVLLQGPSGSGKKSTASTRRLIASWIKLIVIRVRCGVLSVSITHPFFP